MSIHARCLRATTFAAIALVVIAGCASKPTPSKPSRTAVTGAAAAPARSMVTTRHAFAAFNPSGAPSAGVAAHRSGSCWTSSITVSASNAYRCLAGNEILDPCFATSATNAHSVYCYANPWTKAVALSLRRSHLPKPDRSLTISQPWAIALAGGTRCVVTTGTSSLLHGVAMRYACSSGVAGLQSTSGAPWHALYRPNGAAARTVAVIETWTA